MPHLKSLHEGEELVRRILDAVPGGVVHLARNGTVRGANAEALRLLGHRFEELDSRPAAEWARECIHEDGSPCAIADYPAMRVLATGEPSGPVTLGYRLPDGATTWAVFRAVPIHDDGGRPDGAIVTFLDITERKRAEEALQRSEERWRAIAENIPDYVCIVDLNGIFLQVNRVSPTATEPSVIGRAVFDYVDQAHRTEYRAAFDRAVARRTAERLETRAVGRAGSLTWYEIVFVPLQDGERVLIVARDMTDRKRAEDAIRASELQWRMLAENVPAFIALVDREARIISANKRYPELSEEQVLNATLFDYVSKETLADYRAHFQEVLDTASPVHFESHGYGPGGAPTWYDSTLVPLVEDGTVQRLIVVARDMTDQKRAEDAIRASEQKWRALVENLPDAVIVVDRDYRILSVNKGQRALPEASVIGEKADRFVDETMVDEWRRQFEAVITTGRSTRLETRAQSAPGVISWYESIFVPLEENGEVARVMIVARDITERRAMLASFAEKERLASVGMVAASVAHEIMNPLTYVLANLDFALGSRNVDDPRWTKALTDAREGAKRMQQIVWDLRALARVGGEELFYVDTRSVLETALRLSGPEVGRAARVVLELHEVPGVLASESRLCQVFINLLVNAAQAMEDRPLPDREIRVRTRHDDALGLVGVEISDKGVGIARDRLERIFEPFYTTKQTGTGLGLSISRDIVRRMGGRIDVESTPGCGTTFIVWLSTTRAPAAGAAE